MRASLNIDSLKAGLHLRLAPTPKKMQKIANAGLDQVRDRFNSGGASGGQAWPPGAMPGGKIPPLAALEETFSAVGSDGEAKVSSDSFIALVQHLGTIGKGGVLPTIVPKNASVLYIPLTPLGRESYEARKQMAPVIRTIFSGMSHIEKPDAENGGLVGTDAAKFGRDFIFAKRVDLPPRPQLPVSDGERASLAAVAAKALKGE